jgi:hypothetical protein
LNEFIAAAREYCALAEGDEPMNEAPLGQIRSLLLRLIFHIAAVEAAPRRPEFDGVRADDARCAKVGERFGNLGFSFYRVVFDPHDLDAVDEPVMGLLSDDLTDIFRDVAEGLTLIDRGQIEGACFN